MAKPGRVQSTTLEGENAGARARCERKRLAGRYGDIAEPFIGQTLARSSFTFRRHDLDDGLLLGRFEHRTLLPHDGLRRVLLDAARTLNTVRYRFLAGGSVRDIRQRRSGDGKVVFG